MCSARRYLEVGPGGFSHSEISGSKVVCTSPELIAAYYVLHRLPVPRHPPYALSSFLTSLVESVNTRLPCTDVKEPRDRLASCWWRWPGSNRRPTACKAVALPAELHPPPPGAARRLVGLTRLELVTSRLSGARSNHLSYRPAQSLRRSPPPGMFSREDRYHTRFCSTWFAGRFQPPVTHLRKEVIQPHLPVRLPCYDLAPVIGFTFGASLLAVGPATSSATDSHGLTGGVYKARERIHRGILIRDY